MKLKNDNLDWIYQQTNEFKEALISLDYLMVHKRLDSTLINNIRDNVMSMALSFLMIAMGDNVPKSLWQVDDFSVLYGILDAHRDDDGMNLRDYD